MHKNIITYTVHFGNYHITGVTKKEYDSFNKAKDKPNYKTVCEKLVKKYIL